ncbi:MAG: hypothetical protein VX815_03565 [Gemmatimonadota bacterium]|nr:hypothetical protein [Gemmatimonadota bacterium]
MPRDALNDIELLIRSRYGLTHLDTPEEDRAGVLPRRGPARRPLLHLDALTGALAL